MNPAKPEISRKIMWKHFAGILDTHVLITDDKHFVASYCGLV